jgi:acyl carrier protein
MSNPMSAGQTLRATVLRCLGEVAPEMDPAAIDPRVPLREQLDLDSMDVLNFAIALHHATGIDVPEVDYPKLATLDGCVDYLTGRGAPA